MLVREIMQRAVKTCRVTDDLQSVAMTMWNDDCGAVPLVDEEGYAIGILTDRDIAMAAALKHCPLWDIGAGEVKPGAPLYSCRVSDDVQFAVRLMGEKRVRRLLVLDDKNAIEGIIAIKDILAHTTLTAKGKASALGTAETLATLREICQCAHLKDVA
jgi:CBS domain-containing protein